MVEEMTTTSMSKQRRAWIMYDWANSTFATTVIATLLPIYFSSVINAGQEAHDVTSRWAIATSIGLVLTAFLTPFLGAMADLTGKRKVLLMSFTMVGVAATALLYFIKTGDWMIASLLYVLGNIAYSAGHVFYDSLLQHVSTSSDLDEVSTRGYALGYLAGGIMLTINILMITYLPPLVVQWMPGITEADATVLMLKMSFLMVAIWWFVFSLPLWRNVSEPVDTTVSRIPPALLLSASLERFAIAFNEFKRYQELFKFLIAFWLYNTGISTIIYMATIYTAELGLSSAVVVRALIIHQFVAFPATLAAGKFATRYSAKRVILVTLLIYALVAAAGYIVTYELGFTVLTFAVGLVQGGSQALSRSMFARMTPAHKSAQFFSLLAISEKLAATSGPFFIGLVSHTTIGTRLSLPLLAVFFIAGAALLYFVDDRFAFAVARLEEERFRKETVTGPAQGSGKLLQNQT